MKDLRLMAKETGDDDFSDVRLGGVGRTAEDTHISDQKKAVKGDPIECFDGGRESNKMDRETGTEPVVAIFLSGWICFL